MIKRLFQGRRLVALLSRHVQVSGIECEAQQNLFVELRKYGPTCKRTNPLTREPISEPPNEQRHDTVPRTASSVEAGLIFTAVAALLLGTAVYFLDRDWANTMLLAPFIACQWPRSAVFGAFGGFLPALLHAYAIPVLIIVALKPWPWTRPWVCLLWFTIASTLEWLQSDTAEALFFAADSLPGDMPLLGYLERYSVQGQFDYIDLLATGVGCLTALALTIVMAPHKQRALS